MYRKTITYEDFIGNTRTEDYYFNLSKSELMELDARTPGGLKQAIEVAFKNDDREGIVTLFKSFLLRSIGVPSEDGRKFVKDPKFAEEFQETAAYDKLFIELLTDEATIEEFVLKVIPKDMSEQLKADGGLARAKEIAEGLTNPTEVVDANS